MTDRSALIASTGRLLGSLSVIRYSVRMRFVRSFVLVAVLGFATTATAADIVGHASVIDGDTIEIHGTRIRLWGIDAPESAQLCRDDDSEFYQCGRAAATALAGLLYVIPRPLRCAPTGTDRYGRTVAVCTLGEPGPDIGHWLVANGYALDWPKYSKGKYADAQREAEQAERGIWKGSLVDPWQYRACVRGGGRPAACSDDASAHP